MKTHNLQSKNNNPNAALVPLFVSGTFPHPPPPVGGYPLFHPPVLEYCNGTRVRALVSKQTKKRANVIATIGKKMLYTTDGEKKISLLIPIPFPSTLSTFSYLLLAIIPLPYFPSHPLFPFPDLMAINAK